MQKQNKFISWLGYRSPPNFDASPKLGIAFGIVLNAIVFFLIVVFFGMLVRLGEAVFATNSLVNSSEVIRNIGLAIVAVVGFPFLVWRSVIAQQQVQLAEQGLITDRLNKAVEGLGAEKTVKRQRKSTDGVLLYEDSSDDKKFDPKKPIFEEITVPNIEVRVGALFALHRIAKDSDRDWQQIHEIIRSYLSENLKRDADNIPDEVSLSELAAWSSKSASYLDQDLEVATEVYSSMKRKEPSKFLTSLRHAGIVRKVILEKDFSQLDFTRVKLCGSWTLETNFSGTCFFSADLKAAKFGRCLFQNADFTASNLSATKFFNCIFDEKTTFTDCKFRGTAFQDVDLRKTKLSQVQIENTFGDQSVMLPDHLTAPSHWCGDSLEIIDFEAKYLEWINSLDSEI